MKNWLGKSLYLSLVTIAAVFGLVACSSKSTPALTPTLAPAAAASTTAAPTPAAAPVTGKITVFAASSLTDAFNEMKTNFIKANPSADIEFQFAGTPALRTQMEQGAKADVFASADLPNMQMALASGLVADAGKTFAKNSLVIVTPKNNPKKVAGPMDLKQPGLKLVLAAPEVPVGNYARQAFMTMSKDASFGADFSDAVLKNVVSNETNVKQVLAKVQLGEADAGVVYGTDVTADVKNDIMQIVIPTQFNVIAEYPIALTKAPGNPNTAKAFMTYVLGSDGQAVLKKYGFAAPN